MKKSKLIYNLLLVFSSIIFALVLIEGSVRLIEFAKRYFEDEAAIDPSGDYGNRKGYTMHCYQPYELALHDPIAAAKMMSDKKYAHLECQTKVSFAEKFVAGEKNYKD